MSKFATDFINFFVDPSVYPYYIIGVAMIVYSLAVFLSIRLAKSSVYLQVDKSTGKKIWHAQVIKQRHDMNIAIIFTTTIVETMISLLLALDNGSIAFPVEQLAVLSIILLMLTIGHWTIVRFYEEKQAMLRLNDVRSRRGGGMVVDEDYVYDAKYIEAEYGEI